MFQKIRNSFKSLNSLKSTISQQHHCDRADTKIILNNRKSQTKKGKCDLCLPCELLLCLGCFYGIYPFVEEKCYNNCVCDPSNDCSCGRRYFGLL